MPAQQDAATLRRVIDGWPSDDGTDPAYRVLCAGYALDLLDAGFTAPPPLDDDATLLARLNALPWTDDAWHAGHVVDAFGTALLWRRRAGATVPDGYDEALFGWLVTHVDPATGVWGAGARETGMLLPVNGFYRATRGTSLSSACPCLTRSGSSTRCSRTPPTSGTSPRTVRTRATCSMSPTRCG